MTRPIKIAILYSGAIRTLAETINNNLDYFLSIGNVTIDLYFSIWDHIGYTDHINSPDYIRSNRILSSDTIVTEDLIRKLVPNLPNVNIKAIKIEKYHHGAYHMHVTNGINPNLCSQYYKIWDCWKLLRPDYDYDYDFVIRMRCDLLLNNNDGLLRCLRLLQIKNKHLILFPNKIWYNYIKEPENTSINEMIWIAHPIFMKPACNIYNNSVLIDHIVVDRKQAHLNYGENICYMNLEVEKMADKIMLFDFDYRVLR